MKNKLLKKNIPTGGLNKTGPPAPRRLKAEVTEVSFTSESPGKLLTLLILQAKSRPVKLPHRDTGISILQTPKRFQHSGKVENNCSKASQSTLEEHFKDSD